MSKPATNFSFDPITRQLWHLTSRVELLEEKAFKKVKRLRATEAQRFLLLFHLGLVDPIIQLDIPQKGKAVLLSLLLDMDGDNARKFLSELAQKQRPLLETASNYHFLEQQFRAVGMEAKAVEVNKILVHILNAKDKKGK